MSYPKLLKNECERLYVKYSIGEKDSHAWVEEQFTKKAVLIPFVEMVITTFCNLKCKFCSNLIPYYKDSEVTEKETIFRWIDNLSKRAAIVFRLKIHGGEPLTHPDIAEIIDYACSKDNILDVRISTNGTIIPQANTWKAMQNSKFHLHISDYESTCNISTDKLEQLAKQFGVNFFKMKDEPWQDLGGLYKRERAIKEQKILVEKCNMSGCRSLQEGRLYVCSRSRHGERQGHYIQREDEALDIIKGFSFESYLSFYQRYNFTACNYCDGAIKGKNEIAAGEQLR